MLGDFEDYQGMNGSGSSQKSSSSSDIAVEEVADQLKSVEVSTSR